MENDPDSYVGNDRKGDAEYMVEEVGKTVSYDGPGWACPRLKITSFDPKTLKGTFELVDIWPLI